MKDDHSDLARLEERAARERQVRMNPWARTADRHLGAWLDNYDARYVACVVHDNGDREMRWILPRRPTAGVSWRPRELLVRSLGGDLDRWEIVYRKVGDARVANATRVDRSRLREGVAEMIDAGLPTPASSVLRAVLTTAVLSALGGGLLVAAWLLLPRILSPLSDFVADVPPGTWWYIGGWIAGPATVLAAWIAIWIRLRTLGFHAATTLLSPYPADPPCERSTPVNEASRSL